ncbi:hypothetical protein G6F57_012021 [Rhizopus arrhizus]|nr:hypothetical protein G6F23_011287 [Rhizopus arrhizus]KAG0753890.1 hypothetical protein G6F24_012737 [Rhizopus arrhizus]KAG0906307.1 hypothetical protein G6F33_011486 [Rhizopus arrhizus]KAG0930108.1 hypothetical protein G6F30_011758 [Rhizopus arrhizus]KAG0932127.1 hypothetical protein G6F32_011480 [Rhizopus arrhizus]
MIELYLEDDKILQIDEDEPTEEVYVSLMSMMRANTAMHNTEAAIEIDDEVNNELYNGENLHVKTEEDIDPEDDEQVDLSDEVKKQSSIAAFAIMMSVRKATAAEGIIERSAYRYKKQWNEFGTLKDEHGDFLIRLVDKNAEITIAAMHQCLSETFPDLSVSNRGWSVKGTPTKIEVPTARGTSITILGAISLRNPTTVSGSKKRRADGKLSKLPLE